MILPAFALYLFLCRIAAGMKQVFFALILLLALAVLPPASAQNGSGLADGDSCWQCPVCGYVVSMTPAQAASISAYTPCPVCYSAYAGNFVPVSCPETQGYNASGGYGPDSGYDQSGNTVDGTGDDSPGSQRDETGSGREETDSQQPVLSPSAGENRGKILMVLAPQQYQEDELNIPRDYFQSMGYSVVLASKGVKTATGMNKESTPVDLEVKSAKPSDYVAVVFVGGEGIYSLKIYQDPDYQALAKAAVAKERITAAICLGPWILADAGLLQGKKATAAETDHIKAKGAVVSDQPVVRDGIIITANGPSAAGDFAREVVAALEESGTSEEDSAALVSAGGSASKWKCTVCGYIYDPAENGGVPFEKLPSTWKCPCNAPKSKFVKI